VKPWLLLLAGPLAWFASLGASFAAAPPACWFQTKAPLFIIPCAAALLALAAALSSWRSWSALGRELPGESGGAAAAARTLSSGAAALNAFFVIVIIAQFVSPAILGVCQ
jgi:hypothetical protein